MFNRSNLFTGLIAATVVSAFSVGCAEERNDRNYVQELALKKSAFQGEWYYAVTAIESPYQGGIVFPGQQDRFLHKISWKIEKGFLYAYSTVTEVRGADRDVNFREDPSQKEPIAAFAIASHFDIQRGYNPVTGEENNTINENTTDRLWQEREYMRVDWSKNLINNANFVYGDIFRAVGIPMPMVNPVGFFVEDENHPFAPKFFDDDGDGIFDYIDIVHQVTITPDWGRYSLDEYLPAQMTIRNSFRRITEADSGYEPLFFPDEKFERFGYFRNTRETYDIHRKQTDFLDYFANRHDIWEDSLTDTECASHAVCKETVGGGSRCDFFNDVCTIPYVDRTEKPVVYTLTVNFPDKYRDQNTLIERGWNRALQETVNSVKYKGRRLIACMDEEAEQEARATGDPTCCTTSERVAADAKCVPNMYIMNNNSCMADTLQAYLTAHPEVWSEAIAYTDDGEITAENLIRVCAATQASSRRMDIDEPFHWEQLGDLRYNFISFIHSPSDASPLGYGPTYADPETGQAISASANVYGAALEAYKGFIMDVYDLVDGVVDAERFTNGEHMREYFQNAGSATGQPSTPHVFMPKAVNIDKGQLEQVFNDLRGRFKDIEVLEKQVTFGGAMKALAGTEYEDMILNEEYMIGMGLQPGLALTDEIREKISPFRRTTQEIRDWQELPQKRLQMLNVYPADAYTDATVVHLVDEARRVHGIESCRGAHEAAHDTDEDGVLTGDELSTWKDAVADYRSQPECREWAIDWILSKIYRAVMEHEIGHTMGLRHNFEGSFDEEGYPAEYHRLKQLNPLPEQDDFDANLDGALSDTEFATYLEARADARRRQELTGTDTLRYSSIMDYGGEFYTDFGGLGRYDIAAVKFAYGDLREIYDGAPNSTFSNRKDVPYYSGGEICVTHEQCPSFSRDDYDRYQDDRPSASDRVTQTCGIRDTDQNQRKTWRRIEDVGAGVKGFCSNWDEDYQRAAFAFPRHNFCSDERVGDRPHCNRFDEGPTSVDIVMDQMERYERRYVFNNFRRYRRDFGSRYFSSLNRYFSTIGKQFQSMVWRLFYQDGFNSDDGPGGFRDMFTSSIMAMNFFGQVLTRPAIGPYRWNEDRGLVVRCGRSDLKGECSDGSPSEYDLTLANGGKFMWTSFEEGYFGSVRRLAQIGTYFDKILAIEALTTRSWSNAGGNDEAIPLNYYDAFGDSMLDLFSGVITENYERFAPVAVFDANDELVDHVEYRDYWYGTFFGGEIDQERVRGFEVEDLDPELRYDGNRLIDPSVSIIHRMYGLIYSLALFSSRFDATYADYVQLKQYDATWDPQADANPVNPILEYRSPLRGKIFRAVQTDDNRSVAADLVSAALAAQEEFDRAQTADERERARRRLSRIESFLNISADIIKRMGIAY